ncbi:MAG: cytochrome [Chloroflexi bacterium]|jgi:cytochrome P450|nr:cytochrome [Chloroflexota bacterium]
MTSHKSPPGPKNKLPFGIDHLFSATKDALAHLKAMSVDGDVVHYVIGAGKVKMNVYHLNHPDYIREVLVTNQRNFQKGVSILLLKDLLSESILTSSGDFHLRQRRLAQPAFHKKRIAAFGRIMTDFANRKIESWPEEATLDMAEEMKQLTLEIVVKSLFDSDLDKENTEIREALEGLNDWAERILLPPRIARLLGTIPIPVTTRFNKARQVLNSSMDRLIAERRASGKDHGDLLSMLLQATDEEGDKTGMSNEQVRYEILTMFLAGHETTALALMWTWYLLSQNPDAVAKLHAELDSVLAGRTPTVADLPNLPYTEKVFTEVMRLYPPAYATSRYAVTDQEVGGYIIPAGSRIIISQYVTHHDPRFFPDPEKFDPDRWTPEFKATLPKFAYWPFGGGPRLCIGEPFAWMEGALLIATIAQRCDFRLLPGHPVATRPQITLRARYGMKMIVSRRKVPIKKVPVEAAS